LTGTVNGARLIHEKDNCYHGSCRRFHGRDRATAAQVDPRSTVRANVDDRFFAAGTEKGKRANSKTPDFDPALKQADHHPQSLERGRGEFTSMDANCRDTSWLFSVSASGNARAKDVFLLDWARPASTEAGTVEPGTVADRLLCWGLGSLIGEVDDYIWKSTQPNHAADAQGDGEFRGA
jgi:hypothetical protein